MRPIAFYLPQYHEIEENNKWWGKGFTEWNSVRNAVPYFKSHIQPKRPLDDNYYDLSDANASTLKWQADLAQKYGIYGFCIYHYWFKNCKKLLEKPAEILLKHNEIDVKYFFCWANEPWKRTWYSYHSELLLEQEYGSVNEWTKHYEYLSRFFKDSRYIKIDGKPVIAIYRCSAIEELREMRALWNQMATSDGFPGIHLMSGDTSFAIETRSDLYDSSYRFEPAYTLHYEIPKMIRLPYYIRKKIVGKLNLFCKKKRIEDIQDINIVYKYAPVSIEKQNKKVYPGICPSWDNTPRKLWKGTYFMHSSPDNFKKQLIKFAQILDKDDFIFINAWNEWSEGAYLEPDKHFQYEYLEAIKSVVME